MRQSGVQEVEDRRPPRTLSLPNSGQHVPTGDHHVIPVPVGKAAQEELGMDHTGIDRRTIVVLGTTRDVKSLQKRRAEIGDEGFRREGVGRWAGEKGGVVEEVAGGGR
ncbi:hypothetical protein BaRGS_00009104 [Batillaria attramentaria]|uniref:Uncharacterized protein n=1 Tax=Batillaria attramentaria TaxID=370345 RepID=A0ABD0LK38_9CAEN